MSKHHSDESSEADLERTQPVAADGDDALLKSSRDRAAEFGQADPDEPEPVANLE